MGTRALLHALRHYTLWAQIILADFNLVVSTQTAKPPNLIPRQIFQLHVYGRSLTKHNTKRDAQKENGLFYLLAGSVGADITS